MFNFIYAGFNAKIKINDNFFNVDENTLQPVDETFENLTVFAPHNKLAFFVPYTINKNDCIIYKHEAFNASIYNIKPNYFLKQNGKTLILENEHISATFITRGKCFLSVCESNQTYTAEFAELCLNPQIIATEHFLVVYANNCLCSGYSVLAFDLSTKTFCFNAPIYEIKRVDNELCIVDFPLITGAAKATVYNLVEFKSIDTYYVKLFEPQINAGNVPLLFFYAIKTRDFNYAKSLLSPTLATSATSEMLEAFFKPYVNMYKSPFKKNAYVLCNNTSLCDIEFNLTADLLVDNFSKN